MDARVKPAHDERMVLCYAPGSAAHHAVKNGALRCVRGTTSSAIKRSRLHGALHAGIDGVERCRTADVKSVSLLTAEAQIGHGFRYVDFSKEIAVLRGAARAVLVRVAPTHRAPDASFRVAAHSVGNAGLGHVREDFAVRRL